MSKLFRVKCPKCGKVQDLPGDGPCWKCKTMIGLPRDGVIPGHMTNTVILEYASPEEMRPL